MQLLIIDHKTVWGGGQVALVNVLRAWQATRAPIEPIVICPPRAELAPRVRALNLACETFDLGAVEKTRGVAWNVAQRVAPAMRLLATIQRTRPRVILANGAFSFLAGVFASKLARVPIVWWEHNTTLPGDALLKRMMAWANQIVVVSETIRAQFVALAPDAREKIAVIFNGVDTREFCAAQPRSRRSLMPFGWDENVRVVGTVSRLSSEKGIAYFIDAAREILREMPATRFLIVGDGPLRAELEQQSAVCDLSSVVRLVGAQENVIEWLNALDVFVMPSLEEAFGIAVVEAMACELPVVASDVGGLREIVLENETGLRVPPRDADKIAGAVLELLRDENKRRAFGTAGRARAEKFFTLERQAKELQKILERGGNV